MIGCAPVVKPEGVVVGGLGTVDGAGLKKFLDLVSFPWEQQMEQIPLCVFYFVFKKTKQRKKYMSNELTS